MSENHQQGDVDKNLFAFQFFSAVDKDFVLNEGPWAFDGNILLLRPITGFKQSSEVQFTNARFWVKGIDVPPIKQALTFAKILGDNLGQLVGCDETNLFCTADKSVHFQVHVNITKPLRRVMCVLVKRRPIWISFKYIKLPKFCYGCGRLGCALSSCYLYEEVDDKSDLQYGDWLGGSLIKPTRRNAEAIKQGERRLFLAYRNGLKKKLVFDGPHDKSTPYLTQERDSPRLDDIGVDDMQLYNLAMKPLNANSLIEHSSLEMKTIKKTFRDFDGVMADARGHSGEVALFSKKGLDVSLMSISLNHVDPTVKNVGCLLEWRFTGIYGYPETHSKYKTCDLLKDLSKSSNLPWPVGGDINEIFLNFEKKGRPDKQQAVLDNFRDAFSACNLHDLGFSGYEITWWTNRDGD
ncbi:hypothetical protein Cgig2_014892 [Carnegiea gigantea]|uniref:Zinc knuckle CX2CX4HX4C domain-containing protein n=1 Tax=Carnegiea gigantea TaxID=171969 RepID=A0A9Q1GKF1_9CARY|nr:hypothetical protein Cgig2_014892 [Carnegiea gigantea]